MTTGPRLTCGSTVTGDFGNCRKLSALLQVRAFLAPVTIGCTCSDSYRDSYRAICQVNRIVSDSYRQLPTPFADSYRPL